MHGTLNETPQLSVVMATYQRAETIKRTLACLAAQDLEPARFELIVVDDGSSDDTAAIVEQAAADFPFRVEYLRHENAGPGYTQNRGIKLARGEVLLLMADDIWMEPQALRRHLEFHSRPDSRENYALIGSVYRSPEMNETAYLRNWDPHQFRESKDILEMPYYMFWACNVSLKLKFMRECGMFRDRRGRAGSAAHEDPELGYRLMQKGMRLFYDSSARGYHYHYEDFDITIDRMYQRGLNFGEFRKLVGQPEVSVAYHVLNRGTLRDHWQTFTSERKRHLLEAERNPLRMALHYGMRSLLFNRVTVPLFWLPLLRAAERSKAVEALVHPRFYHGLMGYYFQRGAADGNRKFEAVAENT